MLIQSSNEANNGGEQTVQQLERGEETAQPTGGVIGVRSGYMEQFDAGGEGGDGGIYQGSERGRAREENQAFLSMS